MFHKLIVAAGLGFGVLSALPTSAAASDARGAESLHSTYEVLIRSDHHHPWRLYGVFHSHHAAHDAAHDLQHDGYEVRIDVH